LIVVKLQIFLTLAYQSYAGSFENFGLKPEKKRKETNAFKNIFNSNNDSASSFWLDLLGFKLGFWPLQCNPVNETIPKVRLRL